MICERDTGPDGIIVVMVNPSGRLVEARKFCDGCIRSGRAFRELRITAEMTPRGTDGRTGLHEIMDDAIDAAIDACAGNMMAAARLLKISRSTMYRHMDDRRKKQRAFIKDSAESVSSID